MKKRIVLSINPQHVKKIFSGEKIFEYRRKAAKENIASILIYETAPMKRIVAEAEIAEVLAYDPDTLWEKTKDHSGITKAFFDDYFSGREIAYAYRLGKITVFDKPRDLADYGLKTAPQSYAYAH